MAIIIKKAEGTGIPKSGDVVKVIRDGQVIARGVKGGGGGGGSTNIYGNVPVKTLPQIKTELQILKAQAKARTPTTREDIIYSLLQRQRKNPVKTIKGIQWQDKGQNYLYSQGQLRGVSRSQPITSLKYSPRIAETLDKQRLNYAIMQKRLRLKKELEKKQKTELKQSLLLESPSNRALRRLELMKKPKQKNILEKAKDKYYSTIDKRITESQNVGQYIKQQRRLGQKLTKPEELALLSAGFQLVGIKALRGFTTPFIMPIETVKGLFTFGYDVGRSLIHLRPTGSVSLLIDEFVRDPIGTSVEMYAVGKAFSLIGKGLKPLKKTKIGIEASAYGKGLVNKLKISAKEIGGKPGRALLKSVKTLEKAIRKQAFKQKSIRTVYQILGSKKLRTVTRSRRKALLKELKRQAKETPTAKILAKQIRGKKAITLEKQRLALRRQQKIEQKIAQGKQVKALRPLPSTKGYFFKDAITGAERYFKSRKQWLRAVKQQARLTRDPKGDLIKNLGLLKKKSPTQIKKILEIQKQRLALRRQQKIEQKIAQGKQVKALRPLPSTKGYFFKDAITGAERYFKSRKQWLRAVKQQAKDIGQINDLIKNSETYIKALRKKPKTITNMVNSYSSLKRLYQRVRRTKKEVKSPKIKKKLQQTTQVIEKEIQGNQRQSQVLLLKKAKPLERQATKLKQELKAKATPKLKAKATTLQKSLLSLAKISKFINLPKLYAEFSTIAMSLQRFKTIAIPKVQYAPLLKQKIKQLQKQKSIIISAISQAQAQGVSTIQGVSQGQSVAQAITQTIQQAQQQGATQSVMRSINKLLQKTVNKKLFTIPRLSWTSKIPKGYVPKVNILVRRRGRIRELKAETTPNRALRRAIRLVDNKLIRSFQLKIVGIRPGLDIGKQSLKKFRLRKGTNPRVLKFVEKTPYLLDTIGEKREIRASRRYKKYKRRKKNVKKKVKRKARVHKRP